MPTPELQITCPIITIVIIIIAVVVVVVVVIIPNLNERDAYNICEEDNSSLKLPKAISSMRA